MKETTIFEAHSNYVLALLCTRDGQTLVSSGMDNVVKLWSVADWSLLRTIKLHANSVNSISLSPDESVLASGSSDNTVKICTFPDGQLLQSLQDRKRTVAAVRISPDGRWVAAASYGGRATVWTLDGTEVVGIKTGKGNLNSIAFSPDMTTLATSGLGDEIALWSLPSGDRIGTLSGHKTAVWSLTFFNGGRFLVSVGYEGTINFWDTENWSIASTLQPAAPPPFRALVFSPDESIFALSVERKVQLWSVKDLTLQAELAAGTRVVNSVVFSPDGKWLASGAADRRIRVWELEQQQVGRPAGKR